MCRKYVWSSANGNDFTLDNRRLLAFQEAGMVSDGDAR